MTAAQAFNQTYLVPPIIMAAAAAAATPAPFQVAMEDLVEEELVTVMPRAFQVQPSQGAVAVAVEFRSMEVQAAPAS